MNQVSETLMRKFMSKYAEPTRQEKEDMDTLFWLIAMIVVYVLAYGMFD